MIKSKQLERPSLVHKGIWTPWAELLCYECHGRNFSSGQLSDWQWEIHTNPLDLTELNRITTCDRCARPIQVYDEVAEEHNMALTLKEHGIDAVMEQTGGMNSACRVNKIDEREMISDDEDCAFYLIGFNKDGDKQYILSSYDEEYAYIPEDDFQCGTKNEMVSHI